jgi:hypothetical protein
MGLESDIMIYFMIFFLFPFFIFGIFLYSHCFTRRDEFQSLIFSIKICFILIGIFLLIHYINVLLMYLDYLEIKEFFND